MLRGGQTRVKGGGVKQGECPGDKMLHGELYQNAERGQINQSPKIHQMPQYLVSF